MKAIRQNFRAVILSFGVLLLATIPLSVESAPCEGEVASFSKNCSYLGQCFGCQYIRPMIYCDKCPDCPRGEYCLQKVNVSLNIHTAVPGWEGQPLCEDIVNDGGNLRCIPIKRR